MRLPPAQQQYDMAYVQSILKLIEEADAANYKKAQDIRLQRGERIILEAPNGSLWKVAVSNAGTLSAVAV